MPRPARSTSVIGAAATAALAAAAAFAAPAPAAAQDRDNDGISDELELAGAPGEPLLDFPAFGADPDVPDVFVQMDWFGCDPLVENCGPNNSLDHHRSSSRAAQQLADYFAPDVRLHIDNGVVPTDPGLAAIHGAWGGATRSTLPCGAGALGVRQGYFHRGHASALGGGGGGDLFGYCFGGDGVHMGVLAQELGHNFGMDHGGNPGSYPTNCKPHYRSPMNYAYTYDPSVTAFSRKRFDVVLDPTAMDEELGLGTTDADVLETLRLSPWEYSVRNDGAIDWNRDGIFQAEPVRASPTWAWASCEQSTRHADGLLGSTDPAVAWLGGATPRLLMITLRNGDRVPTVRTATRFDLCDPEVEGESCLDWLPGKTEAAPAIPGAPAAGAAPAVAAWSDASGGAHVALIYAGSDGQPVLMNADLDGGGALRWSAPVVLGTGALSAPPVLLRGDDEAQVELYAPVGGVLRRIVIDPAAGTVVDSADQVWSDGSVITPCGGVGVARGFIGGRPGAQRMAAITTGMGCRLEIALLEPDGTWAARPHAQIWKTGVAPFAGGPPSVAYVPFERGVPEIGRFYVTWKPFPSGAGLIAFTQGNSMVANDAVRRLVFHRGTYLHNLWAIALGGVVLAYDERYDDNIRATWSVLGDATNFSPFADGVLKVNMRDQDDYGFIQDNLACSLTRSCQP